MLHAVKDGSEPAIELMNCEISSNGYQFNSSESVPITSTFVNSYVLDLDRTFFPGSMIQLRCWVDNTNHNDTFDDVVWLENVAFQYTAEQ